MEESDRSSLFRKWHRDHWGIILKISRAYTFDPADQEDLIQEISLQIWNSIPNFREECQDSTWVYRVALNTAIGWGHKEKRRREKRKHFESNLSLLEPSVEPPTEKLEWIYEQIRKLDPIDRSLMLLHLEGQSYQEIASILGISEKNVGVKLSRLRKSLTDKARKDELR